jgi:hypothetical protein
MVEFPKLWVRKIENGSIGAWKIGFNNEIIADTLSWGDAMQLAYDIRNNAFAAVTAHILASEA